MDHRLSPVKVNKSPRQTHSRFCRHRRVTDSFRLRYLPTSTAHVAPLARYFTEQEVCHGCDGTREPLRRAQLSPVAGHAGTRRRCLSVGHRRPPLHRHDERLFRRQPRPCTSAYPGRARRAGAAPRGAVARLLHRPARAVSGKAVRGRWTPTWRCRSTPAPKRSRPRSRPRAAGVTAYQRHRPRPCRDHRRRRLNFHGRTTTIVGFSTEEEYRDGFGPFAPGFRTVPFGDLAAMEAAITPNTAAVLVEPIQGEGGIIIPPKGWLAGVRALCDRHNVLLILDEVQTGLGRTGAWFAFEHENIKPEPADPRQGAGRRCVRRYQPLVGTRALIEVLTPGSAYFGSTRRGNALAAAVGLEALCVLEEENLVARSALLGAHADEAARRRSIDPARDQECARRWLAGRDRGSIRLMAMRALSSAKD